MSSNSIACAEPVFKTEPGPVVLHVDMDAFFASVEQRDHPEWRGKPVIVGAGPDERGVVSTCSYEARRFGVRSAMPSRTAAHLCPEAIFVRPRMDAYQAASQRVFAALEEFSPFVEAVSIDEAFLDVTGTIHLFGSTAALAARLRARIRAETGLACSAGAGPNRLLAKIASEEAKPDGYFEMPAGGDAIREWLRPRPAKILWGVGRQTAEVLARYGFETCGDLQQADPRFLEKILGGAAARSIMDHARGIDATAVAWEPVAEKSVSREHTFGEDERDREKVRGRLLELVEEVGRRFRSETRKAKTAKLKLRDADFTTVTRQCRLERAACDDLTFRHAALKLLDEAWPRRDFRTIRLVGFGVTDISSGPSEDDGGWLFPDELSETMKRRERLARAIDACGEHRPHWGIGES